MTPRPRIPRAAGALLAALALAACGRGEETPEGAAPAAVVVEARDVAVVRAEELVAGPAVSGSLEPVTRATLRAEVGGTVTGVFAQEGEAVGAGELLVRIADPSLDEARRSAETAVRSARVAAENARRDVGRQQELVAVGAVPRREIEVARGSLASAQAQLSEAEARLADAREQVADATVQSPIGGVVEAREVSQGDVVQPGTVLFTVIDPGSMQLEAAVPSEEIGAVRVGAPVEFRVRGYGERAFAGRVARINPSADPATRQVPIHVSIPNPGGRLVAGLFAEGRVSAQARRALVVPVAAVRSEAGTPVVTRVRGGKTEQVAVRTGVRDEERGVVEIVSGLAAGDTVLVGPAAEIGAGTPVRVGR